MGSAAPSDLRPRPSEGPRLTEHLLAFALYALIATLATWPLITDLSSHLAFGADRFDGYGTIWFGEHCLRALRGETPLLHSTAVAWPEGLSLRLADSFFFGLIYLPFRALGPPAVAFNLFGLWALATTAWSGFWMVRVAMQRSLPAALAGGLVVGFNALQHTYRIEGEAYLVAGFFLPLFAGQLYRSARSGALADGLFAGLLLGLLAWSSGYFAIDGAVVAVALGCTLLPLAPNGRLRPVLGVLLGALALIAPLAALVLPTLQANLGARNANLEGEVGGLSALLHNIMVDSATLSGWWFPDPDTAHLRQQRLFYLGWPAVSAAAVAAGALPWRRTLPWVALAGVGALLSLGPILRLDDADAAGIPLPYAALAHLSSAWLAYRMPLRFLSVAFVGLGALVGLFADRLWVGGSRLRVGILGSLLLIDGLLFTGLATDHTRAEAQVPSAYAALSHKGAVLDVFAPQVNNLSAAGSSAYNQAHHGAPILADFTQWRDPRAVLSERLALALATEDEAQIGEIFGVLSGLGVTEIALHPGGLFPEDRRHIEQALQARARLLQGPSPEDHDPVSLYAVPTRTARPRDEALGTLRRWSTELP